MKKLFGKIDSKNDTNVKDVCNCIGKSFIVGKMTVVVEEILAEGIVLLSIFQSATNFDIMFKVLIFL